MPQMQYSMFQRFNLSAEEKAVASVFPTINIAYLHNLRTDIATQILNLRLDLSQPAVFAQDHASLVGRLELLNELIGDTQ
jgi:hypothetical protein